MLGPLTPVSARALLAPSARVLVAAAARDGGMSGSGALPWSDVHWPTLLSLTSFERAESQVFRLLRAAPDGAVPDDVTRAMQQVYRVSVFRSAELADAAALAVDALAAAGVRALWLKGAALAMQHAEGFSLRSMGDLDVLVAPGEHARARAALRAAGWAEGIADATHEGHHHDAPMVWRGGVRLELHRGLFPPGHPFAAEPAEDWLSRGRVVAWGDRTVSVLPLPWHLVHASMHWAWSHEGAVGTWQYLHDVNRWADDWAAGADGWREAGALAARLGATRPLGWALWTVQMLGTATVDAGLVERLRGRRGALSGLVEREWVLRALHSPAASPSVAWSRYWWRRAMGGLGDGRQAWPWRAGKAGMVEPAAAAGSAGSAGAGATRAEAGRAARWRRHLARVLGG